MSKKIDMNTVGGVSQPVSKKINMKTIGFFLGIIILLLFWFVDITPGLSVQGRRVLALVLFSVTWWATKPVMPAFTSLIMLLGFMIFDLASMSAVTKLTATSTFFIYFSIFVIADVVEKSGLAKRVALLYAGRFITGFKSMIVSAFVLTFILGFLIPSPWPRAFLLMAIFKEICDASGMDKKTSAIVGLAIFACSCPLSMATYTGDAALSVVIAAMSGQQVGFMDWTLKMIVPGLLAALLTYGLIMFLFKPTQKVKIDASLIKERMNEIGPINRNEKVTLFWVIVATLLWMTESFHGLNTGVVGTLVVVCMSLPFIGGVCTGQNWKAVDFGTMVFVMGAMAIGVAGGETGMSTYLAKVVFPNSMPTNIYAMAIMIGVVTVCMHMILGSSVSTASVVVAMMLAYFGNSGIDPLILVLFCYTAVYMHYIFPFQHLNILFGMGKGGFTEKDVMRLGIPLTACVFIVLLFEAWFWQVMGWL